MKLNKKSKSPKHKGDFIYMYDLGRYVNNDSRYNELMLEGIPYEYTLGDKPNFMRNSFKPIPSNEEIEA